MGLFDTVSSALKGVTGQVDAATLPAMLNAALAKTSLGNLQGMVDALKNAGLDQQVASWLGPGKNLPVTADQLRAALGDERVKQLAASYGIPVDAVLNA